MSSRWGAGVRAKSFATGCPTVCRIGSLLSTIWTMSPNSSHESIDIVLAPGQAPCIAKSHLPAPPFISQRSGRGPRPFDRCAVPSGPGARRNRNDQRNSQGPEYSMADLQSRPQQSLDRRHNQGHTDHSRRNRGRTDHSSRNRGRTQDYCNNQCIRLHRRRQKAEGAGEPAISVSFQSSRRQSSPPRDQQSLFPYLSLSFFVSIKHHTEG